MKIKLMTGLLFLLALPAHAATLLECERLVDTLDDSSHKHAYEVSEDLKYALQASIEAIGNAGGRLAAYVSATGAGVPRPSRTKRSASGMRRAAAKSSAMARSAVVSTRTPGVLPRGMPRRVSSATSAGT